ncbi:MAG TPA: hypothetical protein PK490_22915, partial [Prosthecobacter sp.]|nr:hypothetical protein [Prosthecobacter sp.]
MPAALGLMRAGLWEVPSAFGQLRAGFSARRAVFWGMRTGAPHFSILNANNPLGILPGQIS